MATQTIVSHLPIGYSVGNIILNNKNKHLFQINRNGFVFNCGHEITYEKYDFPTTEAGTRPSVNARICFN